MDQQISHTEHDLSQQSRRPCGLLLARTEQLVIASCVFLGFLAMVGYFVQRGGLSGRLIEIERAKPVEISFLVNINTAEWPELTLLPNIGETLARRIIAHRTRRGPFQHVEQLLDVDGIGPKTLKQITPQLLVVDPGDSLAEGWEAENDIVPALQPANIR